MWILCYPKKKYNETWFKTFWNLCIFVTFAEFAAWENERGKVNIFAIWNMRSLIFLILGRFHQWSLYFRMFGKGLQLKTTALLVFFLWLVKSEKLVNNRIVDHLGKCGYFRWDTHLYVSLFLSVHPSVCPSVHRTLYVQELYIIWS